MVTASVQALAATLLCLGKSSPGKQIKHSTQRKHKSFGLWTTAQLLPQSSWMLTKPSEEGGTGL